MWRCGLYIANWYVMIIVYVEFNLEMFFSNHHSLIRLTYDLKCFSSLGYWVLSPYEDEFWGYIVKLRKEEDKMSS